MADTVDFLEEEFLNHMFRGSGIFSAPANVFLAAFTVAPDDAGAGGTEVTGGSYARKSVACTTGEWTSPGAAPQGEIENINDIDFVVATADWGTIVAIAAMSLSSGGDMWYVKLLATPITINNTDQLRFTVGKMKFRQS